METVYRTKDGKIFETKIEAEVHESRSRFIGAVMDMPNFRHLTPCFGSSFLVAQWILSNLDEINKLVKE